MKGFKDDSKKEPLIKKLETLVSFSLKENIYELELEEKGLRIKFRRQMPRSYPYPDEVEELERGVEKGSEKAVKEEVQINYEEITSPLTGTFYRSASPDTPAFVEVGDIIKEGQVIGLIEAMKLFNEIKSGISGKIVEILAKSGQVVKAGDVLMRIERI